MKRFVINPNDAGQRVDKFITKACPAMPQSALYKGIRTKNIKLNRKRCEISTMLCEGDVLEIYLPDDMLGTVTEDTFRAVSSHIDIIYEDENIILIDKPQGLVVHEDDIHTADTLANRLKAYLCEKGEYDPERENSFAPALCNRLDRNTGGIVIAAKNAAALREMNLAVKERRTDKTYMCIVSGRPPHDSGILTAYLYKDEKLNRVYVQDKSTPANKEIRTGYRVLESKEGFSLLEIDLLTGRTHQIRAHMAHIGCPVLGDGKYGDNRINRSTGTKMQQLFSCRLRFHFDSGCTLSYLDGREFTAERTVQRVKQKFADIAS